MTEKQKIFADEYLIDLNATRAYRVAYPSVKKEQTAAVNGSKLLRNTKVADYMAERMKERQKRTEVTQDRVIVRATTNAVALNRNQYGSLICWPPGMAPGGRGRKCRWFFIKPSHLNNNILFC